MRQFNHQIRNDQGLLSHYVSLGLAFKEHEDLKDTWRVFAADVCILHVKKRNFPKRIAGGWHPVLRADYWCLAINPEAVPNIPSHLLTNMEHTTLKSAMHHALSTIEQYRPALLVPAIVKETA